MTEMKAVVLEQVIVLLCVLYREDVANVPWDCGGLLWSWSSCSGAPDHLLKVFLLSIVQCV